MERIRDLLPDTFDSRAVAPAAFDELTAIGSETAPGSESCTGIEAAATPEEAWALVVNQLRERLDPEIFSAWLNPLRIAAIEQPGRGALLASSAKVTLLAPNKFCCEHVGNNYGSIISGLLAAVLGTNDVDLHFSVAVQPKPVSPGRGRKTGALQKQGLQKLSGVVHKSSGDKFGDSGQSNLNPKSNFSNFVVGACNQFAHAVSLQVADDLGGQYNPLFIYGGVGLGKTHLANAIGNASRRRNKKVLLVSSESFLSELISSLRSNTMSQFKSKFRSLDLLIVDDIQFIIGKERTQEEFFHTFNELHNRHKQIIITSDKVPQELVGLEERLRTRFASGISVDLQKPDFETRVAILIKKAQLANVDLAPAVARLIAERIDTNIRELEGAFNRLQALSALRNANPDEEMALEVLKSLAPQKRRDVTTDLVKRIVAEKFNVSVHDIVGKRRTHNIALARQVAMFLCRELTPCSYPELGALFGGRDHSTVIHAKKVIRDRLEKDDGFKKEVESIEASIVS